jgi:hypothetical protein
MRSCQKWMFAVLLAVILLPAIFCRPALGEQQGDKPAKTTTDWQQLDLAKTDVAGATVYYEKSLEPNLPEFESLYRQFLAEREKFNEILGKGREIIVDVNRILGVTDPNTEKQSEILLAFAEKLLQAKPTFYLVTRPKIKSFLKAGGQLPDCTYDRASDFVVYKPHWDVTIKGGPLREYEFAIPISLDEKFAGQVGFFLQLPAKFFGGGLSIGGAIHEVVEINLVRRTKPMGPYWRWFNEGVANVITTEILKKYGGEKIAGDFAGAYDTGRYKDMEKKINLQYWIPQDWILIEIPLETERQIELARYAYATYEARMLVEKNGIECIRRILDEVSTKQSRLSGELFSAIKKVTGEDIEPRLASYQTFSTRHEGLIKYATKHDLLRKDNYEGRLNCFVRRIELQADELSGQILEECGFVAMLLIQLGRENTADKLMDYCVDFTHKNASPLGYQNALALYVAYTIESNKPEKGLKRADELLKIEPDNVYALTAKMLAYKNAGEITEAKKIAEKIYSLADVQSPAYKFASLVLAADPNQPPPKQ